MKHLIFHANNRELVRLGQATIHLTVTSPPYVTTEFKRGQEFDYEGFLEDFSAVCQQIFRVTVPGGRFALNVADIITKYRYKDDKTISRVPLGSDTSNPQRRCMWCTKNGLHVSARNLDGAIPGLLNPLIVWEIKEYWGQTSGGSKMSDAVYECNLVGRELREFEERSSQRVAHIVFIDGKAQWETRKSDVVRFLDLFHQGLIDHLMIGKDVETDWKPLLHKLLRVDDAKYLKVAEDSIGY